MCIKVSFPELGLNICKDGLTYHDKKHLSNVQKSKVEI